MKTHSGASKRFKKTSGGKLRGRHSNQSHIREKMSPKRKKQLSRPAVIAPADTHRIKKLLPGKAGR
jgi:large subunit ribosomal protein L35